MPRAASPDRILDYIAIDPFVEDGIGRAVLSPESEEIAGALLPPILGQSYAAGAQAGGF